MDIDQIGQVVINLLVNAQHVVTAQPEPRCIMIETGLSEGSTFVRVSDNGPGVPEELRHRIFDPFFTTKKGNVGTGIGLSVSRGIAREHGGDLHLDETASGASFTLLIPLDTPPQTEEDIDEPSVSPDGRNCRALVVDDEPEIGAMLVEILESAGIRATWASSGEEAVTWLEHHSCDLILSDIRMPDMDGPALWREIKQRHPDLLPHMAFVSGDTLSATITPFLKETGAPLLEKPFTPEQVLELVARIEGD
jgi:CheY-like chemotaxis protein